MARIRNYIKTTFFMGLAATIPIVLTIYIIEFIINATDGFLSLIPGQFSAYIFPGLGLLIAISIVFLAGVFARNFFGRLFARYFSLLVAKLPFIATVYKTVKQVSDAFFNSERGGFKKVVLVEWPRKDVWTLAFVSSSLEGKLKESMPEPAAENMVNLFVPTTPNPTSGFFVMVSERQVVTVDLSIEEAFKAIISSGKIVPG